MEKRDAAQMSALRRRDNRRSDARMKPSQITWVRDGMASARK
jgi:hypothetical protein